MSHDRRAAIGRGLASLAKAAILAFGVPLALVRLWMLLSSAPANAAWRANELWIRAIILIVALLWAKALVGLVMDIRSAMRGADRSGSSWSTRWAVAIAGLALVLSVWHANPHSNLPFRATAPSLILATRTLPDQPTALSVSPPSSARRYPECLSEVALRSLGAPELWSVLATQHMDREIVPGERFVDPSLLRDNWCLSPLLHPSSAVATVTSSAREQKMLEELEWLGLGVLGTAALVRRLNSLRTAARSSRDFGERLEHRDSELEAIEARLEPFGQAVLLDWIEVANRLLRRTAGRLRITPEVTLVRAGPAGVTFFFTAPLPADATPFSTDVDGYSWTLPLTAPLAKMQGRVADVGRMIPSLIPVGDDGEHCYLVAVAPGQSLTIDAPSVVAEEIVRGITTGLRTLPWAEELHVELMNLAPPPATEHCYQMAHSSAAALAELASNPPPRRHPLSSPAWRREPLIITEAFADDDVFIPAVAAVAGVIQLGTSGTARLHVDSSHAWLEPYGIELRVPRPDTVAQDLMERLFARASTVPAVTPIVALDGRGAHQPSFDNSAARIELRLFDQPALAVGLTGTIAEHDYARIVEVLAYLALHYGTCTTFELGNALFPRANTAAHRRVEDVLAATRRALGATATLHLSGDVVHITEAIHADWMDLTQRLAGAKTGSAEDAIAVLRATLEHRNFSGNAPYRWMETEGFVARLCFELCDGLHHLFALALARGDGELASRAIRYGLQLEPTSELLVRDQMILRSQSDGPLGVMECYEQLEAALVEIGGREPSWTTRALYDELAGTSSVTP